MSRKRRIFDPDSSEAYRLSRARIEAFVRCRRCFYLDQRLGVRRPSMPGYTLNQAVDQLLKKEFDAYRQTGQPHPLMTANGVMAVPFQHARMDEWRNNFKGITHLHQDTNFVITGAIDDVWTDERGTLIIVDYKATSTAGKVSLDGPWKEAFKRQLEVYQWLFRRNGFTVSKTGYFVYCNALKTPETFNSKLNFDIDLLPYEGDDGWVEPAIREAHACLSSDDPPARTDDCEWCAYRQKAFEVEAR